jgi:putative two-component system response regulator
MQKTIFVVDDSLINLSMAEEALEKQYRVTTLSSAEKMFTALEKVIPDLILLDIAMPETSGFDAMKKLKAHNVYSGIPIIFLTALNDSYNEALGIELGAVDFITKPFSEPVLLNRIRNHLDIDGLVRKRTEQLLILKNGIVSTLADIVERRDKNTGGHVERTAMYLKILLRAMIAHGVYSDEINEWDFDVVVSSARLHDVGKIFIPDYILNKPGPLTDEEFETVKGHALEGERIINQAIIRTGEAEFLQSAKLIAAYHHERWDGSGYPYGLKGSDIPLHGRIMAIIDVYDALVSERPYKKAFSHEEAVEIIQKDSGKHFDPAITDVFCEVHKLFEVVE